MHITDLELLWKSIKYKNEAYFEFKRIDSICIPELNLGYNPSLNRCLILEIPSKFVLNFKTIIKKNISLEIYRDTNYIVIQLIDTNYCDLFNDLILSIYNGIKNIKETDKYCNLFIHTFFKWSEFFEDNTSELLSEEAVKGLMGELLVLKLLINQSKKPEINAILNSWKGPYRNGNDFELENKNLEVKTKSPSGIDVMIASEYQLEILPGKNLELYIVSLVADYDCGFTLKDLTFEIIELIHLFYGDASILWGALKQLNINSQNIIEYDRYRFQPINWIKYDCTNDDFPKLNKSNIPTEISKLKYNLRVTLLESFIIDQGDF